MTDNKKIAELLYPNNKYTVEQIEKMYPNRKLPAGAEVTRFAPSPTGYLHLGGFFQAVIDRFLAKKTNGVFFLRLEDTDKKREVEGAEKIAVTVLNEFALDPDEGVTLNGDVGDYGPYRQSERTEIYKAYAKMLVEKGRAFPCFCTATDSKAEVLENREKMLEEMSTLLEHDPCRDLSYEEVKQKLALGMPFAIRLKSLNKEGDKVVVNDRIKGKREIPANLKDVVLIKQNGIPPYPFAHPVDDHLMGTTVVVRGEEWFSSVAQHIEIFEALGFKPIDYIHTALLCKIDENTGNKRKISKRHDPEADMRFFITSGYPKLAVIEYLLTLANSNFEEWRKENPNANVYEFPFAPEKMSNTSPMVDMVKLNDISKNVISRMKAVDVYSKTLDWAKINDKEFENLITIHKDIAVNALNIDREIERPRKDLATFKDVKEKYGYFFNELLNSEELCNFDSKFTNNTIKLFVSEYLKNLNLNVTKEEWFAYIKDVAGKCGFATDNKAYKQNPTAFAGNTADACAILRIALTGRNQTPDLYSIMQVLGDIEVTNRLKYVLNKKARLN